MKITRAIEGFLFHKEADGASPNTLNSYRRDLAEFGRYCLEELEVDDIQHIVPDHIRCYLHHLRTDRCLAPKTVKNVWVVLSSLWTWAGAELDIPHIVRKVPCPKSPPPDIVPFTKEEVVKLIKSVERAKPYRTERRRQAERIRPTASRDKAILLILLDTGVRVSELCNLTRADVDIAQGSLFIQNAKHRMTTKSRHVYLGKIAKKALWDYLADRQERLGDDIPPDAPLIASNNDITPLDRHDIRRLLYRCADRAGVKNVYPHRFRHTFAINYIRNGGDAFTLQMLLGHSSLDMVKIYLKLAEQDCATTHRRASPADCWHL